MIIEILSSSNPEHDRERKFKLYQDSGVTEYWLVDPEARAIEVFVLDQGKYQLLGRFEADQRAISKVLAGFEVGVDEVIPVK